VTASTDIPDALAFAADALMFQGALVERSGDECVSVVPAALADSLGIPESCTLTGELASDGEGRVHCGIGSPLLDRLAQWASAAPAAVSLRLELEPPRAAQARGLAERFVIRNAVFDVEQTSLSDAAYLVVWVAWRAEADDRYDGRLVLAIHAGDGGEPDSALIAAADPSHDSARLLRAPDAGAGSEALGLIARRAGQRARQAVAAASASVARRHARDYRRIIEYFEGLVADARAPKRRVEADAIAKKVDHLVAERDAKLRDLGQRYALRVSLEPLAAVAITVPAAWVKLRARRRKRQGELMLRLPAGSAALDRLSCAACGEATARPALCDDALHVLCETCVPLVQGRPACRACLA
jgi:hypothetical protein